MRDIKGAANTNLEVLITTYNCHIAQSPSLHVHQALLLLHPPHPLLLAVEHCHLQWQINHIFTSPNKTNNITCFIRLIWKDIRFISYLKNYVDHHAHSHSWYTLLTFLENLGLMWMAMLESVLLPVWRFIWNLKKIKSFKTNSWMWGKITVAGNYTVFKIIFIEIFL